MKHLIKTTIILFTILPCINAQSISQKLEWKVNKQKNKMAINSTHEKFTGKIVFSQERIPFKNEDESLFIESTNLSQPLFLRQYWNQTMESAYKNSFKGKAYKNAALLYEVFIDNNMICDYVDYSNSNKENVITWYTTWADVSTQDRPSVRGHIYSDVMVHCLGEYQGQLSGIKNLKLVSYIYNSKSESKGEKMAEGSINLSFQGADLSSFNNETLKDYPSCMPKPKMINKDLENKLLQATKNKGWKEKHIKAVINTNDFTIKRHPISGIITGRTIGASVAANRNGECFYQRFTFHQEHNGNDFSGQWILQGVGEQSSVPCSCLKDF